ncbi:DUF6894 family protein [Rhizobium leguminosarum]|uniref:DUF6894 family protein n=1 Tax=Rhizobium leguminosarum TaxID=384 RepID=UPI002F95B680
MGQEMPIFYFNIVSASGTIADVEGTELATLEDAKREAIRDARAHESSCAFGQGHFREGSSRLWR